MHSHKQESLLTVIMQYAKYEYWQKVLNSEDTMKILITNIINMAVFYKIDGIQFSKLYPKV